MKPCLDCGRPMRAKQTTAAEWPGTVPVGARGLCSRDHERRRIAGTLEEVPALARGGARPSEATEEGRVEYSVEQNRAGLLAYILARRASGLPADGSMRKVGGFG